MKENLGELQGNIQQLHERVGALEDRGGTEPRAQGGPSSGEGLGATVAGGLLNEAEEGIPDRYYKNPHVVIVGARTKQEVLERREKLNEDAQAESLRLQAMGFTWAR
jgi:hypothetical protein